MNPYNPDHVFYAGQKVVLINDNYADWVYQTFDQLPMLGYEYTVRAVTFRRSDIHDVGLDSMVHAILLQELVNPFDPFLKGDKKELAFCAHRFKDSKQAFNDAIK